MHVVATGFRLSSLPLPNVVEDERTRQAGSPFRSAEAAQLGFRDWCAVLGLSVVRVDSSVY